MNIRWVGLVLAAGLAVAGCAATTGATASPPAAAASASAAAAASSPAYPAASAGASAAVSGTVATASANGVGPFLTGAGGRTLYVLSTDGTDTSACTGACTSVWPPFTVPAGTTPTAGAGVTGTLGTFTRPGGATQVAYDGHPLYYFAGDSASGQTNGQGLQDTWGVWHVALAAGAAAGTTPGASAPASPASSGYGTGY